MRARNVIQRIERAEEALKEKSFLSSGCICFPEKERPSFGFPIEMEIADRVKCPLHGDRFTPLFHLYVPKWLREKFWERLTTNHSEQYRKAWFASFPSELWPATEEENRKRKDLLKAEGWKQASGLRTGLEAQ
jgi:hypothetical protein